MTRLLTTLAFCLAAFSAWAGDGVDAAVAAARQAWPEAKIAAPNMAAPCEGLLHTDAPGSARNGIVQVRVRCANEPGWTRYIALRIEQPTPLAVLRSPLARGQSLSGALIDWQTRDALRQPADVLTPQSDISQLTARRDLPAGSVLNLAQFAAPQAIQRGQAVTLLSRASGMEVRAPGEALADAALGARVKIRNRNSRRVVEGIARADGTVEVQL